jgi:hypothetical protein
VGPAEGPGDGIREPTLIGTPILERAAGPGADAFLDSVELVRLCVDGNVIILLWTIGDGPRIPMISGVPSRLGLEGRRAVGREPGDFSTRWANSGGACTRARSTMLACELALVDSVVM